MTLQRALLNCLLSFPATIAGDSSAAVLAKQRIILMSVRYTVMRCAGCPLQLLVHELPSSHNAA